jgi:hypothetical protein
MELTLQAFAYYEIPDGGPQYSTVVGRRRFTALHLEKPRVSREGPEVRTVRGIRVHLALVLTTWS